MADAKKMKMTTTTGEMYAPWDFGNLQVIKSSAHFVAYTGTAGPSEPEGTKDRAVLLIGKVPFDPATVGTSVTGDGAPNRSAEIFRNSKFSKYDVSVSDTWRVELIAPCSQRDVDKYSDQTFSFIRETPAVYTAVTLPYIEAIPPSSVEWVHNILEGKKEKENVLATQPGFMIVKDYKWNDSANLAAMHLLGLVQDRGLRSVRDLRGAHVPLLRAVRAAGLGVLKDQFGIDTAQVRAYFHYLPTFYHLHVHFDHVSADVTATHAVSKAILLDDVIDNLELDPEYYVKASITFTAGSVRDAKILEQLLA